MGKLRITHQRRFGSSKRRVTRVVIRQHISYARNIKAQRKLTRMALNALMASQSKDINLSGKFGITRRQRFMTEDQLLISLLFI